MYYNRSCRACGTCMMPNSHCSLCKEYVSWSCPKCLAMDDVTHKHDSYGGISIIQSLSTRRYKNYRKRTLAAFSSVSNRHFASPLLPLVAFSIRAAISPGCDTSDAWLELSDRVVAFIRSAKLRSAPG